MPVLCALQLRQFLINYGPYCSGIEYGIEFRYDQYQIHSITTCPPPHTSCLERKKMLSSEEETVHACVCVGAKLQLLLSIQTLAHNIAGSSLEMST